MGLRICAAFAEKPRLNFIGKWFFLVAVLMMPSIRGLTQKDVPQKLSVVHVNTGSVYVGTILLENDGEIEMELVDGNVVRFLSSDAIRLYRSDRISVYKSGKYHVEKGRLIKLSLGTNLAEEDGPESNGISSHLNLEYGFFLTPKWTAGIGTGFEFNQANISGFTIDTQVTPLYGFARYYLNQRKIKPFLFGRLGYGFSGESMEFNEDNNGGLNFQSGLGLHFASKKKNRFVFTAGFHHQGTNGRERYLDDFGNEVEVVYSLNLNKFILGFAVEWDKPKPDRSFFLY